jgi:hypothetical protein
MACLFRQILTFIVFHRRRVFLEEFPALAHELVSQNAGVTDVRPRTLISRDDGAYADSA